MNIRSIKGSAVSDEESVIDIKKILLPITGFLRIYALKNQLSDTNTLTRLERLHHLDIIKKPIYSDLVQAYNILMLIRFRFQTRDLSNNKLPSNLVDTKKLSTLEVSTIKKIFSAISDLQTRLNFDFKGGM